MIKPLPSCIDIAAEPFSSHRIPTCECGWIGRDCWSLDDARRMFWGHLRSRDHLENMPSEGDSA